MMLPKEVAHAIVINNAAIELLTHGLIEAGVKHVTPNIVADILADLELVLTHHPRLASGTFMYVMGILDLEIE